jgi:adenine-specific DNA-methyltransferase
MIDWGVSRPRKMLELLPLERELNLASELLYNELEHPSPQLLEWAAQSGLNHGKTELRRVFAQQAALELALTMLLEALPHQAFNQSIVLPFTSILEKTAARDIFNDVPALIKALQTALPRDVLGELYERFTPQAERRTLGQYWTPAPLVEFMTRWASAAGTRILEPALGSGRFVQALEQQLPKSYIRGYEISPLVLLLAQVNATLQGICETELDFRLENFLTAPVDGAVFDAVVCNPPYTRHHHISEEFKDRLCDQVQAEFGVRPNGFTSLFVFFFLKALMHVRPGGKLAFITPSELYEASYAKVFKMILKSQAIPEAIISFDQSTQVFTGVDTAGCITLACRSQTPVQISLIELKAFPGTDVLLEIIESKQSGVFDWGRVELVEPSALSPEAKWSNIRQMTTAQSTLPQFHTSAKIMRGVATGANDFFCLSDDEIKQFAIPPEYLQPVITKTRTAQRLRFTLEDFQVLRSQGHKVWLFSCFEPRDRLPASVLEYIERGEDLGLHERSLLKLKNGRWYMAERREPPPILFTYLSRGKTRFIHNVMGAQALNVFLLAYPNPRIARDPARVKALIAMLNSSTVMEQLQLVGRSYGGDTVKLEPRELDTLPMIDPLSLSDAQVLEINLLFDDLCVIEDSNAPQKALDAVVRRLVQSTDYVFEQPQIQASLFSGIVGAD